MKENKPKEDSIQLFLNSIAEYDSLHQLPNIKVISSVYIHSICMRID